MIKQKDTESSLAVLTEEGGIPASAAMSRLELFISQQAAAMWHLQKRFPSLLVGIGISEEKVSLWKKSIVCVYMCMLDKSASRAHCVPGTVLDLREGAAQVFLLSSQEFYSGTSDGYQKGTSKEVCVQSEQVEAHSKE